MKDGPLIRPAGRISTIAEINEANANRIPIDHGVRDRYASADIDVIYPPAMSPQGELVIGENLLQVSVTWDEVFDPNGELTALAIIWGDGDGDEEPSSPATHTYAGAGTYTVTMYFEDATGALGQVSTDVTVAAA
jgi:hypothetical protein